MDRRGQLYTLEGLFAALIVLLGVFFALQAVTTTPGDVGTSPHSIQQDQATVNDLVAVVDDQTLEQALLYWNPSEGAFHCTPSSNPYYPGVNDVDPCALDDTDSLADHVPTNDFGEFMDDHLGEAYSYNVHILYNDNDDDDGVSRQRLVYQGNPGFGATRATRTVTLSDDDVFLDEEGDPRDPSTDKLVDNEDDYFAPKIEDSSGDDRDDRVYNVFRVEVTIWRA